MLSYTHTSEGLRRVAMWRVLRVKPGRTEDLPVLGWLAWDGNQVPSLEGLQEIPVRTHDTLSLAPSPDEDLSEQLLTRGAIYLVYQAGSAYWRSAGFELVGSVPPQVGDERADEWFGLNWEGLAEEARTHLAQGV
jgi:hypothetical protein